MVSLTIPLVISLSYGKFLLVSQNQTLFSATQKLQAGEIENLD